MARIYVYTCDRTGVWVCDKEKTTVFLTKHEIESSPVAEELAHQLIRTK